LSDFTVFEMVAIFKEMDTDGDGNLSLEECLNYWQEHFPMTNSNKMMNEIDTNGDGVISYDEWHAFWEYLLNNGYSDEQIVSEVINYNK